MRTSKLYLSDENINGINLVERIDDFLNENGISRKEFAGILGINTSTIATWKTRNILPPVGTLFKISRYMNISIDFLVTGDKEYYYFTKSSINDICTILKYLSLTFPSDRFLPFANSYNCKTAFDFFSKILTKCSFSKKEEAIKGELKILIPKREHEHFNFLLNNYYLFCNFLLKKGDNVHSYESNYFNSYFSEIYQRINLNY